MTTRARNKSEIWINDVPYKLGGDGRVHRTVSSQYPQKQVFGDLSKDSNPRTSLVVWDDWTNGIGRYVTDGKEGIKSALQSFCETRFKGHLTLPKLFSQTDPSVGGTIDEINELGSDTLYAALNNGTDAYSYTVSSNTWSDKLHDFPAQVTDSLHFTLGGTEYLAFAHTGGYTYTNDGTSWTDDTTNTLHLAFWDDRLWGIDNTGQLWFATAIGTETNDAQLPLPAGHFKSLFVGPDAAGEPILYCGTETGLWAHDAANSRFIQTGVTWPQHASGGKGVTTWNGEIYVGPGSAAVYRYNPVTGSVLSVGLDRDNGLPSGYRGDIERLITAHNGIIGVVTGDTNECIWEYNGQGWHFIDVGGNRSGGAHVSAANSSYRLYYHSATAMNYRALDAGEVNPDIDSISYAGTQDIFTHITPWFNAGQNDVDKTAIRVRIECTGMSVDETVKVEYALDYSSSYEASTFTVSSDGVTTQTFPTIANNNNEAGSTFRAIRFHLTLNRGATATNTPNVKSLSLEWRRKIPARYGATCVIDHTSAYKSRSPRALKAALTTAIESSSPVEVVWVDDDGDTRNYYMDIVQIEDIEQTGREEEGIMRVTMLEN